jgi:hypothetical protein
MALFSLFTRSAHSGVLCNLTEHAIQLARLGQLDERPLTVDAALEVAHDDHAAISQWLNQTSANFGPGRLPAYCAFHPAQRVLSRQTINTRRIEEPSYLARRIVEQKDLTSFDDWHVTALGSIEGEPLATTMPARSALLLGLPKSAVRETQNHLCKLGLLPRRLELGSVSLLGAVSQYVREKTAPHGTVVCEIGRSETRVYFIGKDGVHTPAALPCGIDSIEETVMKELRLDAAAARAKLAAAPDDLRGQGRRLVRPLMRHLKPAVDCFEMQTGQRIGAMFCAHLPASLGWIEEALCAAIDLELMTPDLAWWMPRVGLQAGLETPPATRSWFQALSLLAHYTPADRS